MKKKATLMLLWNLLLLFVVGAIVHLIPSREGTILTAALEALAAFVALNGLLWGYLKGSPHIRLSRIEREGWIIIVKVRCDCRYSGKVFLERVESPHLEECYQRSESCVRGGFKRLSIEPVNSEVSGKTCQGETQEGSYGEFECVFKPLGFSGQAGESPKSVPRGFLIRFDVYYRRDIPTGNAIKLRRFWRKNAWRTWGIGGGRT